jgi:hypothetical protein
LNEDENVASARQDAVAKDMLWERERGRVEENRDSQKKVLRWQGFLARMQT